MFEEAARLNHPKAKEYVAFAHLFGDHLPHNVSRARELLEELTAKGSPKAQMVSLRLKIDPFSAVVSLSGVGCLFYPRSRKPNF